jgi:hypothetical protein
MYVPGIGLQPSFIRELDDRRKAAGAASVAIQNFLGGPSGRA